MVYFFESYNNFLWLRQIFFKLIVITIIFNYIYNNFFSFYF